jgi:hypothetical protein
MISVSFVDFRLDERRMAACAGVVEILLRALEGLAGLSSWDEGSAAVSGVVQECVAAAAHDCGGSYAHFRCRVFWDSLSRGCMDFWLDTEHNLRW